MGLDSLSASSWFDKVRPFLAQFIIIIIIIIILTLNWLWLQVFWG